MSITSFKSLTMAESCLLSQPSLFYTKTKTPFIANFSKPFKLQNPSYNSSKFSHSLSLTTSRRKTHHSSLVTFVATWENQGEPKWENEETENNDGEGDVGETETFDEPSETFDEPSENLKIFVGNLPFSIDSEKLAMLFEQVGPVEVAEVIFDRNIGRSRGFGFVTMSTIEDVEKAVDKFSGSELDGRLLTVNKAAPRGAPRPERTPRAFDSALRVYVGNLPWDIESSRLEQIFSEHGKVESVRIVYDRETGRSRGFGFVTMTDEAEMNEAIAALDGQSLDGRTIRVNVAEERPRRNSF